MNVVSTQMKAIEDTPDVEDDASGVWAGDTSGWAFCQSGDAGSVGHGGLTAAQKLKAAA